MRDQIERGILYTVGVADIVGGVLLLVRAPSIGTSTETVIVGVGALFSGIALFRIVRRIPR